MLCVVRFLYDEGLDYKLDITQNKFALHYSRKRCSKYYCSVQDMHTPISNNIDNFNKLFNLHKESFILFAKSYVRDALVAEDIYMESMLQFWEKMPELPEGTNIPAYIITIVKNKSLNYLRHQAIEFGVHSKISEIAQREIAMNITSLEACRPAEFFENDIRKIISETLAKMSNNTREIFNLSRSSHLNNKDIAQKFNISEKGVEYHISKALKVLRVALKDYLPLPIIFLLFFQ